MSRKKIRRKKTELFCRDIAGGGAVAWDRRLSHLFMTPKANARRRASARRARGV
jgi:hypothetical protein